MAASAGNAVGAIGGAMKFFEGRKMQKKAERMIDNFKWQDLQNPYENLQVSTLGADLQREEAGRNTASVVSAVQSGGSRAIIGGLGRVQAQNNLVNKQIAADLDQQQKAIDYAKAQDDTNIRAMTENRQANELQGYGQMMNVGMNMKYGGIADVMNAAQAQGQTNMAVMDKVMGGFTGGMGGGGMMGGGGGSGSQSPVTASYGGGLPSMNPQSMNSASLYAGNYGVS